MDAEVSFFGFDSALTSSRLAHGDGLEGREVNFMGPPVLELEPKDPRDLTPSSKVTFLCGSEGICSRWFRRLQGV